MKPYYDDGDGIIIYHGDSLATLKEMSDESVQCCVTSPPYWGLRDYGVEGQLGLEKTPEEYVAKMVDIFNEVKRVLRNDGTLWLNLGDSYGSGQRKTQKSQTVANGNRQDLPIERGKQGFAKQLIGIPWRVAFALQSDGWYLRSDIIWHKPNPMPESATDRPTKSHEYIFLMSKNARYFYDYEAILEPFCEDSDMEYRKTLRLGKFYRAGNQNPYINNTPLAGDRKITKLKDGRNKRTVWTVTTKPYKEAHFATFPPDLIKPCIMAGSKKGDVVLDPFSGSGTTGYVAKELSRKSVMIELNEEYIQMQIDRSRQGVLPI